jgi:hypothetical protein
MVLVDGSFIIVQHHATRWEGDYEQYVVEMYRIKDGNLQSTGMFSKRFHLRWTPELMNRPVIKLLPSVVKTSLL